MEERVVGAGRGWPCRGTVDGFGNVTLEVTATHGGSDRFVLSFTGMISGRDQKASQAMELT